jgi:DNA transformation protein
MAVAKADIAFALDLLSDLGDLTSRKMFCGMCLYDQGVVSARLNSDGTLYLKAKDGMAAELAASCDQFHNMSYW